MQLGKLDVFTHKSYLAKMILWAVFEYESDLLYSIISDFLNKLFTRQSGSFG